MHEEPTHLRAQKTIPHKPARAINAKPSRAKAESRSKEKSRGGESATVSARTEFTALSYRQGTTAIGYNVVAVTDKIARLAAKASVVATAGDYFGATCWPRPPFVINFPA
jgi:hypothetical protein